MPDGQHQTALGQCRYVDHKFFRNFNFNFNYRELLSKSATFSLRGFGVVVRLPGASTPLGHGEVAFARRIGGAGAHMWWAVGTPLYVTSSAAGA